MLFIIYYTWLSVIISTNEHFFAHEFWHEELRVLFKSLLSTEIKRYHIYMEWQKYEYFYLEILWSVMLKFSLYHLKVSLCKITALKECHSICAFTTIFKFGGIGYLLSLSTDSKKSVIIFARLHLFCVKSSECLGYWSQTWWHF